MSKKILVVDDSPENIQVLRKCLEKKYRLFAAKNGKDAIQIAIDKQPDLILLDIMMPVMDGYETCTILKTNRATCEIPIIFVTAKKDFTDETKGLELGAVDYITKPSNQAILLARVQTHIELKEKRDALVEKLKLEKKLAETQADIERITHHDMKTPLNTILTYPRLMLRDKKSLSEKHIYYLNKMIKGGKRLLNMINQSLNMHKMERGTYILKPSPINVLSIIDDIVIDNINIFQVKEIDVDIFVNGAPFTYETIFEIPGEELLFFTMFSNLIKNAFEASPSKENICISLESNESLIFRIHNKGAVPEDIQHSFFEKYTTYGKRTGNGLGTYSAKLIAETMGGSISMFSSEEEGTTITILFPQQK